MLCKEMIREYETFISFCVWDIGDLNFPAKKLHI